MATSKGTGTTGIPVKGKISTAPAGKPAAKQAATTRPGHDDDAERRNVQAGKNVQRPAAKAASTQVAQRQQTQVAARVPAGRGFEEADKDSYAIPFVFILQDNSPQLDTIEGAEAGMFFNSATNEVMPEIEVVPACYRRRFVRWGARDVGGGFKGEFLPSAVDEMLQGGSVKQLDGDEGGGIFFPNPDGTVNPKRNDSLRDTRSHFCLVNGQPAVLAMASTQVKKSKNWMTAMQRAGGDMWDHAYSLSTVREQNEKGKWYGYVINPSANEVDEATKAEAAGLYEAIMGGKASADYEHAGEGAAE